jgi:hypothetical protein
VLSVDRFTEAGAAFRTLRWLSLLTPVLAELRATW